MSASSVVNAVETVAQLSPRRQFLSGNWPQFENRQHSGTLSSRGPSLSPYDEAGARV